MSATFLPLLLFMGADDPLAARIAPLVKAHEGDVAVAVKNLQTGESYYFRADEEMPTASLIKVAVLVEVYHQAEAGKVGLDKTLTLRKEDKVPGSGVLTDHFSPGATFPLRDAVRLMIAYSDNTATNLVLGEVGIPAVNARMKEMGFPHTRLNAKVFRGSTTSVDPEGTKKFGLGSTTAREMVGIFEAIHEGKGIPPAAKQAMLGHLRSNTDKEKFGRLLPPGTRLYHKDGMVTQSRTDAGLIHTPGGVVALCVLTANNKDRRWASDNAGNLLCARIAREVYDHFAAKKEGDGK